MSIAFYKINSRADVYNAPQFVALFRGMRAITQCYKRIYAQYHSRPLPNGVTFLAEFRSRVKQRVKRLLMYVKIKKVWEMSYIPLSTLCVY